MRYNRLHIAALCCLIVALITISNTSCTGKAASNKQSSDNLDFAEPADSSATHYTDTLFAVTLYGPTSYFIYKGEPMGYDYTMAEAFAHDHDMALNMSVAASLPDAIDMIQSGQADLLAYEVPITAYYRRLVLACGPEIYTTQVLVQPKVKGKKIIADVTELAEKDVYVIKDSKYERRLRNLEEEIGASINIITIEGDSATEEDLISMVYEDRIPLTIVDSNIAGLNETYYHDLDISTDVSIAQRASWAVNLGNNKLADEINEWFGKEQHKSESAELLKRYFEMSKSEPFAKFDFSKGYISKYDDLFKKYSEQIGWDWRLMAAQAYAESLFNPSAKSWVGARGLMQVMPRIGRSYGASLSSLDNPETSVKVASKLLSDLDSYLIDKVPNDKERRKFILAAYNCGIGHVNDAIVLAQKHGLDPQKWEENVEKALLWKMNPQYYNDPDVRYGYARGTETSAYVKRISDFYDNAVREINR